MGLTTLSWVILIVIIIIIILRTNKESFNIQPSRESDIFNTTKYQSPDYNYTPLSTFSYCPIEENETAVDKYLRNDVLGGKYACRMPNKIEYSPEDLQEDQNNFFEFRESINRNQSVEGTDTVDKINELYLANNNENIGQSNTKISDLYDGLTENKNYKLDEIYKDCSMKQKINTNDYSVSEDIAFDENSDI